MTTPHATPSQVAAQVARRDRPVPRATPAGRRLSRKAAAQISELGVSPADVDAAIDTPHATETTHQHNGTLYIRGDLGAIVPHDDPCVVVSLFRIEENAAPTPRTRRASGGPARRTPTTPAELNRQLRAHGFEISTGGGHPKATHPDHPGVTITLPHTPSDHRGYANLTADIRRHTGIDITGSDVRPPR